MSDNTTLIHEAYRLAEQRLEWQFNSALAADQRAVSTAAMLIGASAILGALADSAPSPAILLAGAAGLALGAFLAWYSARPSEFYAPGASFEDLKEDIDGSRDFYEVLAELGHFHDKHSDSNDKAMRKCARLMKWSFGVAIASVILTLTGQVITIFC